MSVRILLGDVREQLKTLADESVHCVVTSPPYWGLRDYGVAGQLGMEPTLGEHIETMVDVFREVRRVMRKDATLWLNYGDCYATSPNGRSAANTKLLGNDDRTFRDKPFSTVGPIYVPDPRDEDRRGTHSTLKGAPPPHTPGRIAAGGYLKPKDLCMVPNRLAIAMQEDGWWVRSEIIWHKPNPMPESIKDRPGSSHEKIFLLSKADRYHYDHIAVRQPIAASSVARLNQDVESQEGSDRANGGRKTNGKMKAVRFGGNKGGGEHGSFARRASGNEWDSDGETANLKNVWTIATAAFSDAHFATFPPELVERCIKAGCPEGGTVLDPFGGAGTTGLVADRLKRDAILIELNPAYAAMAKARIEGDCPMFTEVA